MGHLPVLAETAVDLLVRDPNGLYVDGTIGAANHTLLLLETLDSNGRVWGFDWDQEMLEIARDKLEHQGDRVELFAEPFSRIGTRLAERDRHAHGILIDLGLNSEALDAKDRGFRYRDADAPLDMRMDRRREGTAADYLADATEEELAETLRELGEVRNARAVARALVEARRSRPIRTSGDLVGALRRAGQLRGGAADLSRIYQALRLRTTGEIEEIDRLIAGVPDWLIPGGRLVVLSYESISDRKIKSLRGGPGRENASPLRPLNRKVIRPTRDEIASN
ncbi:MAG: 16S rRNA (cytosine(1402)-N(4))-methyltransferase RsmH, partial [Candidatus Eisenbacteria bacterium]|nr:16S rRNA (cytosine(1402)-N(4))-methyltransferase RsmH [Candidatus Latescibacterota bacterium]MBD3303077.1 16S rRNA (cytosine(1402)-N(4))-methyltransferase RsmH [Candidatus Eisenbacteria bacterium]